MNTLSTMMADAEAAVARIAELVAALQAAADSYTDCPIEPLGKYPAVIHGIGPAPLRTEVEADLVARPYNPCFDYVIMGRPIDGLIGPMHNGNYGSAYNRITGEFETFMVMDRYETPESYERHTR